jgi:hypothetical protein
MGYRAGICISLSVAVTVPVSSAWCFGEYGKLFRVKLVSFLEISQRSALFRSTLDLPLFFTSYYTITMLETSQQAHQ